MIKKITRLLEIGEQAKPGDKVYYHSAWLKIDTRSNIDEKSLPVKRETYVVELPEIPEGFRSVTKEDIKNKVTGEFKYLSLGFDLCWSKSLNGSADAFDSEEGLYIINPKQKGFRLNNIQAGMTFILMGAPYNVKTVCLDNTIELEGFGRISVETLNKHFHYLSGGKVGLCSEYQGDKII